MTILLLEHDDDNGEPRRDKLRIDMQQSISLSGLKELINHHLGTMALDTKTSLELFDPEKDSFVSCESLSDPRLQIIVHDKKIIRLRVISLDPPPVLPLAGRFFSLGPNSTVTLETASGQQAILTIAQDPNRPEIETAGNVWDGSILLARYMSGSTTLAPRQGVILELGAGCGLAGLAAAAVTEARSLILTDVHLDQAERNMAINCSALYNTNVQCCTCDWFNPPELTSLLKGTGSTCLDLIIVADCVWTDELVQPLFNTLSQYVKAGTTQVIICYQQRGKRTDDAFWASVKEMFGEEGVEYLQPFDECLSAPDVFHVLSCRKRY